MDQCDAVRVAGHHRSAMEQTRRLVRLGGSRWRVAGLASRNSIGLLAPNSRLDRTLVVLGDLFPTVDPDGEVLGNEDAIASPIMLRGSMDRLRSPSRLRRNGLRRLHAYSLADPDSRLFADRLACRWLRSRLHDDAVDGLGRFFREKSSGRHDAELVGTMVARCHCDRCVALVIDELYAITPT